MHSPSWVAADSRTAVAQTTCIVCANNWKNASRVSVAYSTIQHRMRMCSYSWLYYIRLHGTCCRLSPACLALVVLPLESRSRQKSRHTAHVHHATSTMHSAWPCWVTGRQQADQVLHVVSANASPWPARKRTPLHRQTQLHTALHQTSLPSQQQPSAATKHHIFMHARHMDG